MRKLLVASVAALAFLAPAPARAVVFLGARIGYALPSGDLMQSVPMKDSLSANVPIQVDAGMSVLSVLSLGLYGSYGPTSLASDLKSSCSALGVSCSGQNLRLGVQANLRPPLILDSLWGGVFAGLEQQAFSVGSVDVKFRGWEAGLQAGWDFSVLPFIKVGPFASYSFARFTTASVGSGSSGFFGPIVSQAQAQHTAFTIGLRGLFDF